MSNYLKIGNNSIVSEIPLVDSVFSHSLCPITIDNCLSVVGFMFLVWTRHITDQFSTDRPSKSKRKNKKYKSYRRREQVRDKRIQLIRDTFPVFKRRNIR